jgi:hypothetical protein
MIYIIYAIEGGWYVCSTVFLKLGHFERVDLTYVTSVRTLMSDPLYFCYYLRNSRLMPFASCSGRR